MTVACFCDLLAIATPLLVVVVAVNPTASLTGSLATCRYRLTGVHLVVVVDYERRCEPQFDVSSATTAMTQAFSTECANEATPFITLRVREAPATSTTITRSSRLTPASSGYQQFVLFGDFCRP